MKQRTGFLSLAWLAPLADQPSRKVFFSPLEQFDVISLKTMYLLWRGGGVDLTFFHLFLPIALFLLTFRLWASFFMENTKILPDSWQYSLENIYNFLLHDVLLPQTGGQGLVYLPLLLTLFLFILSANLLSMIPFGVALTSHIVMIFLTSFTLVLSTFFIGLLVHGHSFLKIFVPECPAPLLAILIPIEIFSYVIRAFSLALRLSANIMAGHTLVAIILSFILKVASLRLWLLPFFAIFLFLILLLEVGVAFLQAYVFTILVSIYLGDSLKEPGH